MKSKCCVSFKAEEKKNAFKYQYVVFPQNMYDAGKTIGENVVVDSHFILRVTKI